MLKFLKLNKYRIVEEDNKFYPEERFLFIFWCRYSKFDTIFLENFTEDIYFDNIKDAKEFIINKLKLDNANKPTKIIHKFN